MKALTVKQPYATLIARGIKDIENRTWKTNFRGKIYIHVSKEVVKEHWGILKGKQYEVVKKLVLENKLDYYFPDLPFGAIIGEVEIVDCVINHPSIWAEKSFRHQANESNPDVDDDFIINNWVLANPILYDKPILNIKGKLSLWKFDDGDLSHLMSIMRLNKSDYAGENSIFGLEEPKDL